MTANKGNSITGTVVGILLLLGICVGLVAGFLLTAQDWNDEQRNKCEQLMHLAAGGNESAAVAAAQKNCARFVRP